MTRAERENVSLEKARKLLPKIYEKYPTGGALHVVIDDGNFETHFIVWSLAHIAEENLPDEDLEMFMKMAEYLLDMPESKRYKLWDGVSI